MVLAAAYVSGRPPLALSSYSCAYLSKVLSGGRRGSQRNSRVTRGRAQVRVAGQSRRRSKGKVGSRASATALRTLDFPQLLGPISAFMPSASSTEKTRLLLSANSER